MYCIKSWSILALDPNIIEIQHGIQRCLVVRAPYNSAFSPFRYWTRYILGAPMWLRSDSDKWLYTPVQLCALCRSSRCEFIWSPIYQQVLEQSPFTTLHPHDLPVRSASNQIIWLKHYPFSISPHIVSLHVVNLKESFSALWNHVKSHLPLDQTTVNVRH